ncbi:MAG TPA: NAD(P)-binding protein [Acidimicrobiales bacterium]|nr:NAD(P)-binding protein [Acidimicrobiales bacterium]
MTATAVVVGGGITGLTTALALAEGAGGSGGLRVVVVDRAPAVGGRIATEPFAGVPTASTCAGAWASGTS